MFARISYNINWEMEDINGMTTLDVLGKGIWLCRRKLSRDFIWKLFKSIDFSLLICFRLFSMWLTDVAHTELSFLRKGLWVNGINLFIVLHTEKFALKTELKEICLAAFADLRDSSSRFFFSFLPYRNLYVRLSA